MKLSHLYEQINLFLIISIRYSIITRIRIDLYGYFINKESL